MPTTCRGKLRFPGDKPSMGAPPVPVKVTASGLSAALSVMVTAALRVPVALGVKVTAMVQLAPTPSVPVLFPFGIQEFVCAKSLLCKGTRAETNAA